MLNVVAGLGGVVMRVGDHVLGRGDLGLLEGLLEDVDLGVVLQLHFYSIICELDARGFGVLGFRV